MSEDKHPISVGRADRDDLCWREHTPGAVCLLPEGHAVGDEPAQDADAAVAAAYAASGEVIASDDWRDYWLRAERAVEAARPIIIREEHARILAVINEELSTGADPASLLWSIRIGLTWSVVAP